MGGAILLIHGHQADPVCYGWRARVSRWMVRNLWRRVQNLNILDPTTRAAENPGRCNEIDRIIRDRALFSKGPEKGKGIIRDRALFPKGTGNRAQSLITLITVAGHTHRPVFAGLSLTERRLLEGGARGMPGIARRDAPEPTYYNTGACVLPRCITGIEITAHRDAGGLLRPRFELVKWAVQPASPENPTLAISRTVLQN